MIVAIGLFSGGSVTAMDGIPARKPTIQVATQIQPDQRATEHPEDQLSGTQGPVHEITPMSDPSAWSTARIPPRKPATAPGRSQTREADKAETKSGGKKTDDTHFARAMIPPIAKSTGKQIGKRHFRPVYSRSEAEQCEAALRSLGATFSVSEELDGSGECGWPRPVALTELAGGVKIRGDVRLRCEAALGLALWTRESVQPAAKDILGATLKGYDIGTSYHCRRRNNARSGKLSEHAFANGIDLMAFRFNPREPLKVTFQSGWKEKKFQKTIRKDLCKYFTTVLGPGSDSAHKDHFHMDLAVRKRGYRYCK